MLVLSETKPTMNNSEAFLVLPEHKRIPKGIKEVFQNRSFLSQLFDDCKGETENSYKNLIERLQWYFGPAGKLNLTMRENMKLADLKDLGELRKLGMDVEIARIPRKLLDSVEPEGAERLMELLVRIGENPKDWKHIHKAMELEGSVEKIMHKRSIDEMDEKYHKTRKHKLSHKKRNHRHDWEILPKAAHKTHHGRRKKPRRHKVKNKGRNKHYYGRYRLNSTETKLRHHSAQPQFGVYSSDSIGSVLEKPFPQDDIRYKNKHFERWKVKEEWPRLRNAAQLPKSSTFRNKMDELRRWGLLKQQEEDAEDNWTKTNAIQENWWRESEEDKAAEEVKSKEKANLLATNNWPKHPEEPPQWPRFSYHRVTSSPNFLTRSGRSQKRQRSAYVAVSLIPNNATSRIETRAPAESPISTISTETKLSNYEKNSRWSNQNTSSSWPDLFDQLLKVQKEEEDGDLVDSEE